MANDLKPWMVGHVRLMADTCRAFVGVSRPGDHGIYRGETGSVEIAAAIEAELQRSPQKEPEAMEVMEALRILEENRDALAFAIDEVEAGKSIWFDYPDKPPTMEEHKQRLKELNNGLAILAPLLNRRSPMATNDGGPVYPQTNEQRYADPVHGAIRPSDIYGPAHPGMSLRDWFAGMATDSDVEEEMERENLRRYGRDGNDEQGHPLYDICTRSEARFLHANAMLFERDHE